MGVVSPDGGAQVHSEAQMTQGDVNFFRPKPGYQRDNMRLISLLVVIWAVAVFGFQFLLILLQEPTPEPGLATFKATWQPVVDGKASPEQLRDFARVNLDVLGKNIILKPAHKDVLSQSLSAAVVALLGSQAGAYNAAVVAEDKSGAVAMAVEAIGLANEGFDKIRRGFLPYSLLPVEGGAVAADVREALPGVMDLYLTHNQSVLTDFTFMGFPFHYWYTAQFLLILFVLLCLLYAVLIDRIMIKHGRMTRDQKKA